MAIEKIHNLTRTIKETDGNYIGDNLEIYWIDYKELIEHKENLMYFLWCNSIKTLDTYKNFLSLISSNKITKIKDDWTKEGFHASPAGLSELVFITNPIDPSRIKRAFYFLKSKNKNFVNFGVKDSDLQMEIEKSKTMPALRTITAIKNMDIANSHDFIILDEFEGHKKILDMNLTKWKKPEEFSWRLVKEKASGKETHLAFCRRFNLYSPNTSLFAFYCDKKFIPPDTLKVFPAFDKEKSKFLCLFLNSTFNVLQMLSTKEETTGQYGTIRSTDLILFDVINVDILTDQDKNNLTKLFEKIRKVEFPCFLEQLEKRFWARVELDKTILKILGVNDSEINKWLPLLYDSIIDELKIMKNVK